MVQIGKKIVAFALMLTLLLITGCSPAPAQGEVYNLTLAHFQPATHAVETILIQGWIELVEEATDGRVIITSFPGGTLLPGTEVFEGVVDGVADIGHSAYAYTRGRFPIMETFLVPGITYNNAKVSDWVAMEGINKLDPAELDDVKHLFTFSTGRGDLLTQLPLKTLEDLNGVEIGVTAGQFSNALRLLGATGAVFTMPEHYEVISRGLTQGVLAPMEVLRSFRIAEVTNHVTLTPFLYNQLLFMVMNLETWNSLPTDIQETIEAVTESYYTKVVAGFYDQLNEDVLEWLSKENMEMEITTLSEAETRLWLEYLNPILEEQKAYLDEKGFMGEEILNTVQELAEEYNQLYGHM